MVEWPSLVRAKWSDLLSGRPYKKSVGGNGPGHLAWAGLDILDAWSDGNATPHDC